MTADLFRFPLLPAAALLAAVLLLLGLRGANPYRLLFAFVLGFYLLVVMAGTLFPIPLPFDRQLPSRASLEFILSQVNLVPFNPETLPRSPRLAFFHLFSNVLLTVPLGFLVHFVFRLRPRGVLLLALVSGLAIETTQLALTLLVGARYRVVDIDDVLMNAIGVLAGYALFRTFAWLWQAFTRWTRARPRGLWGYLHAVTARVRSRPALKTSDEAAG